MTLRDEYSKEMAERHPRSGGERIRLASQRITLHVETFTCHGLSQSSAMGATPTNAPIMAPTRG